jgi:hypothetical protein
MSTAIRLIQMSNSRPRPIDGDQVCTWYACGEYVVDSEPPELTGRPGDGDGHETCLLSVLHERW